MTSQITRQALLAFILLLSACASEPEATPNPTSVPPTATIQLPTETSTPVPFTPTSPVSTQDSALFGAITQGEIQAYSLEPVATAIFNKVMDGFKSSGQILDFQVTGVTIFPSSDGTLYTEIIFNVQTTDSVWLEDGGIQASDNWINEKCSRFDFVTTEAEFQLKNQRMCN